MYYTKGFVPCEAIKEILDGLGVHWEESGYTIEVKVPHPEFDNRVYVVRIGPDVIMVIDDKVNGESSNLVEQIPRTSGVYEILGLLAKYTGCDPAVPFKAPES